MNRWTRRTKLAIAVVIAAVVVASCLAFWFSWSRSPLAGGLTHHFGEVLITGKKTEVTHTFHLTNRGDQTITLNRIVPDCGCVSIKPSATTVAAGQSIDITATLALYADGFKEALIHLDLGDHGRQVLRLQATGKRMGEGGKR